MQYYTFSYKPYRFTSFLDYLFDDLLEKPMNDETLDQNKQDVVTENEPQSYPIEITVAGKVGLLSSFKRADIGYKIRTAIDNALSDGIVDGRLVLKYNLDNSLSSLHFIKDLDSLRWDTPYMVLTGPKKALEIIRNMGYTKLACGDDVEANRYMCQITNVYTDAADSDSTKVSE
jgi:hypothetical protein